MGSLKDKAINKDNEDVAVHTLSDPEIAYLKLLNTSLTFHTLGQRIVSGFMYYVATTRLGYKDGTTLQFELNLDDESNQLTVQLIPDLKEQPLDPPAEA